MKKENIKYSIKNLMKRKARSLLTIISILFGIATIFIFLSFSLGLYTYIHDFISSSTADKVTISAKGSAAPGLNKAFVLTKEDLASVERSSGVFDATGLIYKAAEIKQGKQKKYTFLISFDPNKNLMKEFSNLKVIKGRDLAKNDRNSVVLGYNYRIDKKIFEKSYDVNDVININGKNLKIIGFYDPIGNPQDDSQIYINLDSIDSIYNDSKDQYAMIIARVDVKNIDNVIKNVESSLRKSKNEKKGEEDFYVASFQDLLKTYITVLDSVIGFVILIALISVFVSAINTANTMITSVLERIKEIGIIKSIGARNSDIFNIFLFESALLGLIAGIVGVLLGFGLVLIAKNVLISLGWSFLKPSYPWYLFAGCILFAVLTGSIAGVIPAINASKTNPVDALRYE